MEHKIESFIAVDGDGNEYIINVFREINEIMFAGVKQRMNGKVRYRTEGGNPVNVHTDGTLEDFVTGTKMHRK